MKKGFLVAGLSVVSIGYAVAGEGLGFRENLTTLKGKTYRQVRLVKVDPNGLLFRHRGGVAKVAFKNLDRGFREHYGYDEGLAQEFEKSHSGAAVKPAAAGIQPAEIETDSSEIVMTFRTRTLVPLSYGSPHSNAREACEGTPWFSHWERFHPGLAYAQFPCRQLAERDFLISSGILPTPPGVFVHRVYR